jgi:hypothetical protein
LQLKIYKFDFLAKNRVEIEEFKWLYILFLSGDKTITFILRLNDLEITLVTNNEINGIYD